MIAGVPVTPVTIPGWILVGMNLISMVLVIFMNEAKNARSIPNSGTRSKGKLPKITPPFSVVSFFLQDTFLCSSSFRSEEQFCFNIISSYSSLSVRLLDEDEEAVQDPSSSSSSSTSPSSKMRLWILYSAPILCLLLNFLARGVLSIVETDGPYTCQETAVIHHHINATTAPPSPGSISERLNPGNEERTVSSASIVFLYTFLSCRSSSAGSDFRVRKLLHRARCGWISGVSRNRLLPKENSLGIFSASGRIRFSRNWMYDSWNCTNETIQFHFGNYFTLVIR